MELNPVVKDALLCVKTAELAGFIFTADKSPPRAPNAPPMALNLAVPLTSSLEYLTASVMS